MQKLKVPELIVQTSQAEIQLPDRTVKILVSTTLPRLVVLGGFLADSECDQLIELAKSRMDRSPVVGDSGEGIIHEARTSSGMFFGRGENEVCKTVEKRIAALLQWPIESGEGLQVLRYGVGAEYKPHYDYFDPSYEYSKAALKRGGQRVGTLVMYLNTPEQGGGTTFPDVGLEVLAQKGNAVFFSYDQPHADTKSLHGGAPVIAGEKWAATKWLREGEFI